MLDVVVIGGGLSGLAASVKLALNGARVALFEQAPKLGGRCYSYVDSKTGDIIDNGQHVLLGAYHNLLNYLDLIGTRQFLKTESALSLPFHHATKGRVNFEISSLPKPFHLTAGMLMFKLLPMRDRQKLLKVGLELSRWKNELEDKLHDLTIEQWLIKLNQSEEARKCFWYPIAISVMNELPETASALLFARSLRAAFLGDKSDSAILLPKVGQTDLYVRNAELLLSHRHARIFKSTEVKSIEVKGAKVSGIRLVDGTSVKAHHFISAIPPKALRKLIPHSLRTERPFVDLEKFEFSPIISINLWFDKEFMDIDYIGLIEKHLQWIFNRRRIMNEKNKLTSYISAVISGAHEYVDLPKEKLLSLAVKNIHEVFPESRKAKLVHSIVIKEKRATFSPTPAVEPFRPSSETQIKNLFLAGDWTNTSLPATIEGAVLSGFKTVDLIQTDQS